MQVQYLSPLSDLKAELKPLFSNEYMLAFFKNCCDTIESQMGDGKKVKTQDMTLRTFLESFFIPK